MIQDFCDICGEDTGPVECPDDTGFLLLCRKCRPSRFNQLKWSIGRWLRHWLIEPFKTGVAILWVLWMEEV